MKLFVTGGAGFIGTAVIRHIINNTDDEVVNIDKLTYAGNLESLASVSDSPRYHFEQVDICDAAKINALFDKYRPDAIMHLAAESHVDRSIDGPAAFIETNIVGTYTLLEAARAYWSGLDEQGRADFRFHHISTDEVYGDLAVHPSPHKGDDCMDAVGRMCPEHTSQGQGERGPLFTEESRYEPNSPYSASKASSDHLVRAWHATYGMPVVVTNCSNNYGPYQFTEKLIPLMILNAIEGKPLPIYGKGDQVRDWLYVDDHARALYKVVTEGRVGETYNIGGHNEKTNLEVVNTLCGILDELVPNHPAGIERYADLITYVADRPGHDKRYAIDASKIEREFGWVPDETFETGIRKTVQWYLDNSEWCEGVITNKASDFDATTTGSKVIQSPSQRPLAA